MRLLEYTLAHPYPRRKWFTAATIFVFVIVLPGLVLINIITAGYELVPVFRDSTSPNDTVPEWWNPPFLPKAFQRSAPACQPRDFGRGDRIRLTPSLFEYTVLSAWRNASIRDPANEARITYDGASFNSCYTNVARFDYDSAEQTHTVTTGVVCQSDQINAWLETSATFANDPTKDLVARYYGLDADMDQFVNTSSRNYRLSVFEVLDIMSTDAVSIMYNQGPVDSVFRISTRFDLSNGSVYSVSATYFNGTTIAADTEDNSFGPVSIYEGSIRNLVNATVNAVQLDLGHAGPDNIFFNKSAVNSTFRSNLPPAGTTSDWARGSMSWFSGSLNAPYFSWAQALRVGNLSQIPLGNLEALPPQYEMVANYLCPSYQVKSMSSFLADVFVGTATMFLSVWGFWLFTSAICAQWISKPCHKCTFERQNPEGEKCKICEELDQQAASRSAPRSLEGGEEKPVTERGVGDTP